MDTYSLLTVIALVIAGTLAGVDLLHSRGRALTSWGLLIVTAVLVAARVD